MSFHCGTRARALYPGPRLAGLFAGGGRAIVSALPSFSRVALGHGSLVERMEAVRTGRLGFARCAALAFSGVVVCFIACKSKSSTASEAQSSCPYSFHSLDQRSMAQCN